MSKVENFLSQIKSGCLALWENYYVLPSVAAAQAALESGWGESQLAQKYNNLFGIKGSYNGASVSLPTTEFYDGKTPVQIIDGFRSYPNWSTSILDYGLFLNENSRYKNALGLENFKDQISEIWKAGYATDPDYVSKIISTIEYNKLNEWDMEVLGEKGEFNMVTKTQGLQWANNSVGKLYDFDGAYGAQCFDLINQYSYELFKTSFSGDGAIDLLQTGNKNGFRVIPDANGIYPEEGDIFIMRVYSHKWGHTGIVLSVDKTGMWVVDQNFDGKANSPTKKRYLKYNESWGVIVGWIRPPWETESEGGSNTGSSDQTGRIVKIGKFTVTVDAINVRNEPNRSSKVEATYKKGQSINYDSYIINDSHVWISYISLSGVRRYMAVGPYDNDPKNVWGTGF